MRVGWAILGKIPVPNQRAYTFFYRRYRAFRGFSAGEYVCRFPSIRRRTSKAKERMDSGKGSMS